MNYEKRKFYVLPLVTTWIIALCLASSSASAASYDLLAQQDFGGQDITSPAGIRARVTVLPDGKIKSGDNVRFVIRVFNDNSSPSGNINLSFIPDSKIAELVAATPALDFASDYISSWEASGWKNVTIPAKSSRDYSITYRVSPSQATGSELKFTAWLGQDDYQIDRYFAVKIADTRGNQTAINKSGFDNFFRTATGRFPTTAERSQWAKRYEEYRTKTSLGANREDRIGLFMKEIAKKVGSKPSVTATTSATGNKVTSNDIAGLFNSIYGRIPNAAEKKYWVGRIKDKPSKDALKGAMTYQKSKSERIQIPNSSRIKAAIVQIRTLAEVYYDNNASTYRGVDVCISNPNIGSCKSIAGKLSPLINDVKKAFGGLYKVTAYSSKTRYCVSHPLPSGKHVCLDSDGRFGETAKQVCGQKTLSCAL